MPAQGGRKQWEEGKKLKWIQWTLCTLLLTLLSIGGFPK